MKITLISGTTMLTYGEMLRRSTNNILITDTLALGQVEKITIIFLEYSKVQRIVDSREDKTLQH